jgi:hypothetical protein
MVIHSAALTPLQLHHDEYMHLYWLWRGRAFGAYHRLITEQTCKMAMFMDYEPEVGTDFSREANSGIGFDVTKNGADGCTFDSPNSLILVPHDSSLQLSEGTVAIYGDFPSSISPLIGIVQKGSNYYLQASGSTIDFDGITIAHTFDNNQQIAVTFKDGYKPRFFVDGVYIGEGGSNWTTSVSSADLVVGNKAGGGSPSHLNLKQLYIGDSPLADREILALFEEAQNIGGTAVEVGARREYEETFTGTAVDLDLDPLSAFQLIDVSVNFNTAPTTSENLTIKTLRTSKLTTVEHSEDLSLSTDTDHMFRFDKRFLNGRTIAIDYTNTDARTITVKVAYQTDGSVTA